MEELKLINMEELKSQPVRWLWYPYIPFGKITILQGDPGEGKTHLILAVASALTTGIALPEAEPLPPMSVIYQTAEDGLGDTIKPRLEQMGADCGRIAVIDESNKVLTLSDERIEQAVVQTGAELLILDPLQAYLGANVDMHRANEVRPVFHALGLAAERTGCAIVLIGHMNKSFTKSGYRGLGSIDITAAARSVLVVGKSPKEPHIRVMAHSKSNLAPEGTPLAFTLENGFRFIGAYDITVDELLSGFAPRRDVKGGAKKLLLSLLSEGAVPSEEVSRRARELQISERTLKTAKKELGIVAEKTRAGWYCRLP